MNKFFHFEKFSAHNITPEADRGSTVL